MILETHITDSFLCGSVGSETHQRKAMCISGVFRRRQAISERTVCVVWAVMFYYIQIGSSGHEKISMNL